MSRPITRSMTRQMAKKIKHSDLSPAAPEENMKICQDPDSSAEPSQLFMFCQTFPFLLLPGELRNMIYRVLLGPKFDHGEITRIPLSRNQPVITRVNKQIRAESLSIYYAENAFRLEVDLRNDHFGYPESMGYFNFCRFMERFTLAQGQSSGIQNPLRHIRDLEAKFFLKTFHMFKRVARFQKKADRDFMNCRPGSVGVTGGRLGGENTDCADRTSVGALVKQWFEATPDNCGSSPNVQERFIHAVCLLGVNLRSDSPTSVSFDY